MDVPESAVPCGSERLTESALPAGRDGRWRGQFRRLAVAAATALAALCRRHRAPSTLGRSCGRSRWRRRAAVAGASTGKSWRNWPSRALRRFGALLACAAIDLAAERVYGHQNSRGLGRTQIQRQSLQLRGLTGGRHDQPAAEPACVAAITCSAAAAPPPPRGAASISSSGGHRRRPGAPGRCRRLTRHSRTASDSPGRFTAPLLRPRVQPRASRAGPVRRIVIPGHRGAACAS